jgi:hypothetical protein
VRIGRVSSEERRHSESMRIRRARDAGRHNHSPLPTLTVIALSRSQTLIMFG